MEEADKKEFLESLGVEEAGLNRLIKAGFKLLRASNLLHSRSKRSKSLDNKYRRYCSKSCRSYPYWLWKRIYKSKSCKLMMISCKYSGWKGTQEAGVMRVEGKDYVVQDGDLMEFLFNV